jgi:hypothetical protein
MDTAPFFNRPTYSIREHIGFLKLKDSFDILGAETKELAGISRELCTTADNYLIYLMGQGIAQPTTAALLLAAGLTSDTRYNKEARNQATGTTTNDFSYTPG